MPDEEATGGHLPGWVSAWATVIAPVTVLSGLLFYFGYVSSRAQYEYFGIDVDTVGLGTQDYIMRSPQPLLAPLLTFVLLGAGMLTAHLSIRRRIATAKDSGQPRALLPLRRLVRVATGAGLAILGGGIALLFAFPLIGEWPGYDLFTPLLLAVGAGLLAYRWRLRDLLGSAAERQTDDTLLLRRMIIVMLYALVAVGVFWATATVAGWSGRGLARNQARHLDSLPRVILDTKERLHLRSPGVEERVLPASPEQTFHYRYRRLRLLIVGRDRMFLVPETWSASNSTLVVPLDESVRVQFQFQNSPP
ncbi:hypothetical protein [Phytohabitans aurantiacus]|uniref:hypothetical protein n=1 Tax=Phytohabitans aurantiacus TaxID=3016789 RepID=UPI002490B68A|nr:hypothetical protein [Phytohabitans aurantiacus]